jgi:hypothetical protein
MEGIEAYVYGFLGLGANLQQRFIGVVGAFNAHDLTAVSAFLDDNVILTTLTPAITHTGRAAVEAYLGQKFQQVPPPFFQPQLIIVDVAQSRVSGPALWTDSDTTNAHLRYAFTFALHQDDNQWYVINLWGTPGGTP